MKTPLMSSFLVQLQAGGLTVLLKNDSTDTLQ